MISIQKKTLHSRISLSDGAVPVYAVPVYAVLFTDGRTSKDMKSVP